jgi:hypothetical protein
MLIYPAVLDYCGGTRTEALVRQLSATNPGWPIAVLDNGSPRDRSPVATDFNPVNTGVGGGILDCMERARQAGARWLLFITNDIECLTPLRFSRFDEIVTTHSTVVHVSATLSPDSAQAGIFPWMVTQTGAGARPVPHADLLVSCVDLDFVASFGDFPPSLGGWGYSWELAFHAVRVGKTIVMLDDCVVSHVNSGPEEARAAAGKAKEAEVARVYHGRYGCIPWLKWRRELCGV